MKRFFDLTVSFVLLIILFPLICILAFLILKNLGTPIFFKQTRPGLHGKPFQMIKFRTMKYAFDNEGRLLPDSERISLFGRVLRSTSLDELPGLWNVLTGDMSLVGPRPLLMEYLPLYSSEQLKRHNVLPGVTGWAQINGRNGLSWEEKFLHDLWYVDNQNFLLDLKILFLTIKKVFIREGICADGEATMQPFIGNNKK
jgi:lipopolysaccharide/colanic/teichoic acid biosynthesis glycosyltransferase